MYGTYDTEFIYFCEREAQYGTIHDLANAIEKSFYSGYDVERYVIIFVDMKPVELPIEMKYGKYDDNDYARHEITIVFPAKEYDGVMEDYALTKTIVVDGRA